MRIRRTTNLGHKLGHKLWVYTNGYPSSRYTYPTNVVMFDFLQQLDLPNSRPIDAIFSLDPASQLDLLHRHYLILILQVLSFVDCGKLTLTQEPDLPVAEFPALVGFVTHVIAREIYKCGWDFLHSIILGRGSGMEKRNNHIVVNRLKPV